MSKLEKRKQLVGKERKYYRLIDWLIDCLLYGTSAQKGYSYQETLLNKI